MPPLRASFSAIVMNERRTEDNAAPTGGLQWQLVIGIVAGFLSILLVVYLLHLLSQSRALGFPRRVLDVLPLGNHRASNSVTQAESGTSNPSFNLSRAATPAPPAPPPPYTARPTTASFHAVAVPPYSLPRQPVRQPRKCCPAPRHHVDEPVARG
ncbi:hypothetical protein DFH29DRAFT_534227 [Suillus ampliporus]|nr:hypothetical protein DFH29DRAFT_534227 [Suillus ampliporus]